MSDNYLAIGNNIYELCDETITTTHDYVTSLYHFVNKGTDIGLPSGLRFIDDHHVEEAIIAARSYAEAVAIFEAELPLSRDGQLVTVEFFGVDCKVREKGEEVIMKVIRRP